MKFPEKAHVLTTGRDNLGTWGALYDSLKSVFCGSSALPINMNAHSHLSSAYLRN